MSQYEYDQIFLPQQQLKEFCAQTETPFFLYSAEILRERAKQVCDAFAFCKFRPFFPMRALPNPHILQLLRELGYGVACGSIAEQQTAEMFGYTADETVFFAHACRKLPYGKAQLILEEFAQLELLPETLSGIVGLRYHPGGKIQASPTDVFGSRKIQFGAEEEELTQMADNLITRGCDGVGLHCQVERNCDSEAYYPAVAKQLFEIAVRLQERGIPVQYCDLGGGVGYQSFPGTKNPDIAKIGAEIEALYRQILIPAGLEQMELRCQIGRWIAAPTGLFVTGVVSARMRGTQLLCLDASAMDFLQTAIYNTYYHVSILGKDGMEGRSYTDVLGCSQERRDKFAERRFLPQAEIGDICIFHGAGAYGRRSAIACKEYLLDGEICLIKP